MTRNVTIIDVVLLPIWSALVFGTVEYIFGDDFVYAAVLAFVNCGCILLGIFLRGTSDAPNP